MKLFEEFEAIKFREENLILITNRGFLYYIYDCESRRWRKYRNAGNDYLTIQNYPDVSREELMDAMGGKFPQKETEFMRLCNPCQLYMRDMLDLLREDYARYMSDRAIYDAVDSLLYDSDIRDKTYLELRILLDKAVASGEDNRSILQNIKELSLAIMGRDIYKREIGIVDGHDSSSYFWIQPVRVIEYSDTDFDSNVAEMHSVKISIEEDDVDQYLTPFLYKHFDADLDVNKRRPDACGFEWYLTYNFFTFESVRNIIRDIEDTIDALSAGRENEYTAKLRIKRGTETYQLLYAKNLSEEQIREYNQNRPQEDNTEVELIIDFYNRFVYRMEYMMRVGKEKGYNLISFMGP